MSAPPPPSAPRAAPTTRDSGVMAQLPRVRAPTPVRFIIYAYGLTWLVAWPLLLSRAGMLRTPAPFWMHYLTGFGPLLAAAVVAYGEGEGSGVRAWVTSLVRPVSTIWWVVGIAPLVAYGMVDGVLTASGYALRPIADLGRLSFLPPMPALLALLFWTLTSGLGEEAGWRGLLQPILQHLYGPLRGTLMVAVVWAGWHAPFFFYLPSYAGFGPIAVVGFVASLICGAVLLAWMRNASGSVLPCILWHGAFNTVTGSAVGQGRVAAALSVMVIVAAVVVLVVTRGRLGARLSPGDPMSLSS